MMNSVNFGTVADSYARSRNDIPYQLFDSLELRNVSFQGKEVVDIGCGTGALTRKIKIRNGKVVGLDPSSELVEKALEISKMEYLPIEYRIGTAESTGLSSNFYDIVTVFRAWHWFNSEGAIQEINRILKPRGKLLVMDSGFTMESAVVVHTISIIHQFISGGIRPAGSKAISKQRINGFPVEWFEEWRQHEFELRDFYKIHYSVDFTNEEWVDRVASLSWMTDMSQKDRKIALNELLESLKEQFGSNTTHTVPHTCTITILNK
ncbi:class I SAM-dependent methyltransferase [Pseudoneobacillus sp. C159]